MIIIKSPREIELMRESGQLLSSLFHHLSLMIKPGITTKMLDEEAERFINERGGILEEKGYYGYPASICASVNDVLVHGIPSSKKVLKEGDIISLDIVVKKNGYCADACRTYPVGKVSDEAAQLIKVTEDSFFHAVSLIKEGVHLGDICHAVESYVKPYNYCVPEEYSGHGIGRTMHEDPSIPNYGKPGTGPILKAGMTLCIEPMVMTGKRALRVLPDGWTAVARDHKINAYYENTVLVTETGVEILTLGKE